MTGPVSERTRSRHRADIQGLRAVAVIAVVAYHAGLPLTGGFVGVDIFFVVSGFVITGALLPDRHRPLGPSLLAFYGRRTRRLLPGLALLVVVVAACSTLLSSPFGPQEATARTGLAASVFSANVYLATTPSGYFDLYADTNPLLHTWSLSVEEQFYVVFPAFLLIVFRLAARSSPAHTRRIVALVVLVVGVASFALSSAQSFGTAGGRETSWAFFSPATRAWEFGAGVLVAIAAPFLVRHLSRWTQLSAIVGSALLAIGLVTIDGTTVFPGVAALVPVAGTALVIIGGMAGTRGISSLLSLRPMTWIGDVSYGFYLWHWPFIVFARALWPQLGWAPVAAALASLGPTVLSYRFVENPIRFSSRFAGGRVRRLTMVCLALPMLACITLSTITSSEVDTAPVEQYVKSFQVFPDGWVRCDAPIPERTYADCRSPVQGPRGEVFLVGDSNATHFLQPVADAANQAGYDATMVVGNGCPFVDLVRTGTGVDGPGCHTFVIDTLAHFTRHPPSLVVIGVSATEVINNDTGLLDPRTGTTAATPSEKAALYETGLAAVLDTLHRINVPVLYIHTVPHLGDTPGAWSAAACPAIRIYTSSCDARSAAIGRADVETQQRVARDAGNRAVAGAPGASSVDFTDDLCSPEVCASSRSGLLLYRDGTHLTLAGARTLTDRFTPLIADRAVARTPVSP